MAEPIYDVAIVGGSLAGSAAATLLARAGLRVAVLERHNDPAAYKHLCTTLIQASAVPTLQRLGLDGPMEAAGAVRTHLSLWTRWGWANDPGSGEFDYGIRREKLDPMIRELAASTPGVDFLMGHTVRGVLTESGRVVGVGASTPVGGVREIRARLVVGADGRNSDVAKLAGVGARVVKKHGRAGYYAHFRNVELPFPGNAHLWMLEPDCAYAIPQDDGLTILATMFTKDRVPAFKADPQGALISFLQGVPGFARFNPADQATKVIGLIDHPNLWRRRPPPGLAFVGDAAISADPLFGIGCGWALQEAGWLADAVTAGRTGVGDLGPRELDRAVDRYCHTLRSQLGGHYFLISDYSTGRRFNPIEKLTFAAAAKDPEAAHLVARFGARTIPARSLLAPRALGHAVRVNLGHAKAIGAIDRLGGGAVGGPVGPVSATPVGPVSAKANLRVLRARADNGGFASATRVPGRV